MSKKADRGSLLLIEELLDRGDSSFIEELRAFADADQLASFAARWYARKGPPARDLLLRYLERPLNAFRHEPLVKRLFKLAEAGQDDAVMARFLVAFDRSVRRTRRKRFHFEQQTFRNRQEAEAAQIQWLDAGAETVNIYEWRNDVHIAARWPIESMRVPAGTTMPRKLDRWGKRVTLQSLPENVQRRIRDCQLFSVHTRHYLRRRTWRYFRGLGRLHPDRYIAAVVDALLLYRDEDVADGLELIDNWGLMHILFHDSPALFAKTNGWTLAPERKLGELTPSPYVERHWTKSPRALLRLVREAKCRTIRQWAIFFLRKGNVLGDLSAEELLELLSHQDAEVALLAGDALSQVAGLEKLPFDRWLAVLDDANPAALGDVCALFGKHWTGERVTLEQAVALACRRPAPIARLGLAWLEPKVPSSEAECRLLLELTRAESDLTREDAVRWLRKVLSLSPYFQPGWVLELLDCRHEDVRSEGWRWMRDEPRAAGDVDLWRRLLESPYDDVRLMLIAELERRTNKDSQVALNGALDPEMVRFLWASVLLNIHRGNRAKPVVIAQIARRLTRHPGDAAALLPILSVALRSLRGPEWRAGLAAVIELLEREPELGPLVRQMFPELKWT